MSTTLTIRLPADLAAWLAERSRHSGVPRGQIVREQLELARATSVPRPFMRYVGALKDGPPDLSMRKGFSRK